MKTRPYTDQMLDMIDGRLSAMEKESLLEELEKNPELMAVYQSLKEAHDLMETMPLEKPRPSFSSQVMLKVNNLSSERKISWQGLLLFVGVILCVFITFLYLGQSPDMALAILVPENYTLLDRTIRFDWMATLFNLKVVGNTLLFIAFVLAMFIFDKAILRPFFQRRKEHTV